MPIALLDYLFRGGPPPSPPPGGLLSRRSDRFNGKPQGDLDG